MSTVSEADGGEVSEVPAYGTPKIYSEQGRC